VQIATRLIIPKFSILPREDGYVFCMILAGNSGILLTYLVTPWSRILLEKLTGLQLVNKFPAFYETRKFITAFTSALHLSILSQLDQTHTPTSFFQKIRLNIYPPIYAWVSSLFSFPQVILNSVSDCSAVERYYVLCKELIQLSGII
jgi:hypothetical protein